MKAKETHGLSKEELKIEEQRLRKELFDVRSQAVTEKLENPHKVGNLKRDIARLMTEQRARVIKESK
ncbi:MAG: 50S ribosomal protein L29 [Planctomycetes bacterium]|nr:50S ribosomal protein L29 [Planctomycetota bacterium]